jgi:hypothetical protein
VLRKSYLVGGSLELDELLLGLELEELLLELD